MVGLGEVVEKSLILLIALSLCISVPQSRASVLTGELSAPSSVHSLLTREKSLTVEFGVEYRHTALPDINNIVVSNSHTSFQNTPVTGNIANNYPDTFAQTLKAQMLLDPDYRFTVSLKTYLPLNSMTEFDTGNMYQPEFVLYRAESQRPRILLASGLDLNPDWRVGIGFDVGFSVSAQANVLLQSGDGNYSDQRLNARVKPSLIPQASVDYRNFTFAVRGENKTKFDLTTNASAAVLSGLKAGPNFAYTTESSIFYQPWELEVSGKHVITDTYTAKWGLSYQLWSGYQASAAVIQAPTLDQCPTPGSCNLSLSSSQPPSFKARNLLVPEVGVEMLKGNNRYQVGYRYKDSIFSDLPTANGNYLDPPRHDLLLGVVFPTRKGWEWSVNATVSRLVSQTVVKSDSSEIGGPGYTASGWLYGAGMNVAIPFKD